MSDRSTGLDPLRVDFGAFLGLLAILPLTSVGTTSGPGPLWWIGLALLGIGGVLTLTSEFVLDGGR